ncbi:MAG: crotonase/enoyl-CoA hydratase family protein [Chloroflexi bacterium]|nr:crotonase/enoyl-CoA hydratase family protein [Chloroflexota bacterium]MBP8058251.1 crotonase/enoyl-CoA hydratase family protein [Chloroflexota bacterium]
MTKITLEQRGHILMMGLNRPDKRNAFDIEMFHQLAAAYGQLQRDNDLRCGVLFAHGDHFTGGLDLPQWAAVFAGGQPLTLADDELDPFGLDVTRLLRKPVVIAVQGICLTVGLELLLATDIRVAAEDTRFAQIEIKRGIYPVGGATVRFVQEIGWGNAMRYLLTGDEFNAEEAYRLGLVQKVVPAGEQVAAAFTLAETIAMQAPLGVYATLASSRLARHEGEQAAFARLMPDLLPLMQSEDAQEGVMSFIQRREAQFKGR